MHNRVAVLVIGGIAAAALGFTGYHLIGDSPDSGPASGDRSAQSALRDALQAQKSYFVANDKYAGAAKMRATEPTIDWGDEITVVIGHVQAQDRGVVCLSQASPSGTTFSIGDVSRGPRAGLYYGLKACPDPATPDAVTALGASWDRGARKNAKKDGDADEKTALRNAFTAAQGYYATHQKYSASVDALRAREPAIDWGGKIQIVTGDAVTPGDGAIACLWTTAKSGDTYAVGHVVSGTYAGVYYGTQPCPVPPAPEEVAAFATGW